LIGKSQGSQERGAGLLDARSKEAFVQAHLPGSVHLEADDQLCNNSPW
jgi:rhodanese-related sulfurtransferase